jgi:hypothetical protein
MDSTCVFCKKITPGFFAVCSECERRQEKENQNFKIRFLAFAKTLTKKER